MTSRQRRVLVLNQFALPRTEAGGTRHVDIFGRVEGWTPRIVAGHLNHYSQKPVTTQDERFVLVQVPSYTGAGLRRMLGWLIFAVGAVVKGIRLGRPDVVVASSPHLLAPVAGVVLACVWRRPLVVEVRDLWPETLVAAGALRRGSALHRVLVRLERWIYSRADHIVAVTTGWEEHFHHLGVDLEHLTVVTNGTEVWADPVSDRAELRRRHGIHGLTVVYAGAHGPANALDSVLDSAGRLPDLRFLLVGAGSEKARLVQRAARESLQNVEFRDPMPKDALMELMSCCDIGVHSIEPLAVLELGMSPNKLFDYMAVGLPVASNAGRGVSRVLGDTDCALVGPSDSLTESLSQLRNEGSIERSRRGSVGQELLARRFSRVAAAESMREVLDRVR